MTAWLNEQRERARTNAYVECLLGIIETERRTAAALRDTITNQRARMSHTFGTRGDVLYERGWWYCHDGRWRHPANWHSQSCDLDSAWALRDAPTFAGNLGLDGHPDLP